MDRTNTENKMTPSQQKIINVFQRQIDQNENNTWSIETELLESGSVSLFMESTKSYNDSIIGFIGKRGKFQTFDGETFRTENPRIYAQVYAR